MLPTLEDIDKATRKGPGGRPSKYRPEYCEMIIEHMGQGLSATGFAGAIGVSRQTIYEWADTHPEFSDAFKVAKVACVQFWERLLAKIAAEGGGNATAAIFALKNRAAEDWSDRTINELVGKNNGPIEIDARHMIEDRLAKLIDSGESSEPSA